MNYVDELSKQIVAQAELRPRLIFFANNSLYKANDRYRYHQYRSKNKRRRYYLVAVRATSYPEQLLPTAQTGASYARLLEQLEQAGVGAETAHHYPSWLPCTRPASGPRSASS